MPFNTRWCLPDGSRTDFMDCNRAIDCVSGKGKAFQANDLNNNNYTYNNNNNNNNNNKFASSPIANCSEDCIAVKYRESVWKQVLL